jgi:hypothetical protein
MFEESLDVLEDPFHCFLEGEGVEMDVESIYLAKKSYYDKSPLERREFIAASFLRSKLSTGHPCYKELCQKCFCRFYGISTSTFKRIVRRAKSGRRQWAHGKQGVPSPTSSSLHGFIWIRDYSIKFGDQMPDDSTVHLPDYKWKMLHRRMSQELMNARLGAPSYTSWKKMIAEKLPHLRIRKYKRFSKCDTCAQIDQELSKSTGPTKERLELLKAQHNNWQMREREKYYKHKRKSLMLWEGVNKCLTLSIDTMDNSKTALPAMAREPKEADKVGRLHTHVTGVMCHGYQQKNCFLYTWLDRFPSGSDVVNTIITDVLSRLKRPLPPTLHLQMDNCWRENKNRYSL